MKLKVAIIGLMALTVSVLAQSYSVPSFTVDNGGGRGSGGQYRLTGTIGQPDAGKMLQDAAPEQLPTLSIAVVNTNTATVSWPVQTGGYSINGGFWALPRPTFVLQENRDLNTTNWQNVAVNPTTMGTNKLVIFPTTEGNRFFRLKK